MKIPDGLDLWIHTSHTRERNFPYKLSKAQRVTVVLGIKDLFIDFRHSTRFIASFTTVTSAPTSSNTYLNGMIEAQKMVKDYGYFLTKAFGRPLNYAATDALNQKIEDYKTRMMILKLKGE